MDIETEQLIRKYIQQDPTYPFAAYRFVIDGLAFTTRDDTEHRHLTGAELSAGLIAYAKDRYGSLAAGALAAINLRSTRDFGEVVYHLISLDIFGQSPQDSIQDFDDQAPFANSF